MLPASEHYRENLCRRRFERAHGGVLNLCTDGFQRDAPRKTHQHPHPHATQHTHNTKHKTHIPGISTHTHAHTKHSTHDTTRHAYCTHAPPFRHHTPHHDTPRAPSTTTRPGHTHTNTHFQHTHTHTHHTTSPGAELSYSIVLRQAINMCYSAAELTFRKRIN